MNLKVIGTGSSGNAILVNDGQTNLLLDAGVPFKVINKALDYKIDSLVAVLVGHAHFDHSKAVSDLVRAGIPIVINDETATKVCGEIPYTQVKGQTIGDWKVISFPVEHDDVMPVGFLVYNQLHKHRLTYVTDTGFMEYLPEKQNTIIVECSYCPDILEDNRIEIGEERYLRLKKYHFGLNRVIEFLKAVDKSELKNIILVHLSKTNSDEKQMVEEIEAAIGIKPVIAKAGMTIELR